MTKHVKSLDDLVQGIKQLLSENRCSFSDEEKVLLNDCILKFQQSKEETMQIGKPDYGSIAQALEILIKLMIVSEHLKNLL